MRHKLYQIVVVCFGQSIIKAMALDGVTNTEKILECFFMLSDAFCGSLLKTSCENISQKKFLFSPKKTRIKLLVIISSFTFVRKSRANFKDLSV